MTAPDGDLESWAATTIADALRKRFAPRLQVPTGVPDQMAIIQARYGSNRASARATGVDERTWRRWLQGSRPRRATGERLVEAAGRARAASITARFRSVRFVQNMGGAGERTRTADARALNFDPFGNDEIAQHVRRGHYGRAAHAWVGAIRDDAYQNLFAVEGFLDQEYGLVVKWMDI